MVTTDATHFLEVLRRHHHNHHYHNELSSLLVPILSNVSVFFANLPHVPWHYMLCVDRMVLVIWLYFFLNVPPISFDTLVLVHLHVLYAFFSVIPRRLNFICRHFGTLFHLHRQGVWRFFTPTRLLRWNRHSVPKRRHIKFRRRGITEKKAYDIQNKAKVSN